MVRWRPEQEASLAPPCSNLRPFRSKFTVLKKVLVTLLGLFGAHRSHFPPPQWFGAPWWFGNRGILPPCPSLRPCVYDQVYGAGPQAILDGWRRSRNETFLDQRFLNIFSHIPFVVGHWYLCLSTQKTTDEIICTSAYGLELTHLLHTAQWVFHRCTDRSHLTHILACIISRQFAALHAWAVGEQLVFRQANFSLCFLYAILLRACSHWLALECHELFCT